MTPEQMSKLESMFKTRFSKMETELNKNVYIAAKTDSGNYEVPLVKVGSGGGTITSKPVDLVEPAKVRLSHEEVKPFGISYRLAIPNDELRIAAGKPEYFNYLMDAIINKAVGNYRVTVGDENKVRFGTKYLTFLRPDGRVFESYGDDSSTIELSGEWADVEGQVNE